MRVLGGFPATVPRLPARGRVVCAGWERCHDRPGLPQAQAQEWLGRGPTGHMRGAKPELPFIELLEFERGL
jgi:hypothetical protein